MEARRQQRQSEQDDEQRAADLKGGGNIAADPAASGNPHRNVLGRYGKRGEDLDGDRRAERHREDGGKSPGINAVQECEGQHDQCT